MAIKYARYNCILLLGSSIILLIPALINLVIDPYGVFASPVLNKVNHLKPEQKKTGRIYKSFDIRRIKPKVILLGSSRVEEGLVAQHPGFIFNSKDIYNSGFQAANTYEVLRYLEHAINQQPDLQQVIIGLDFFMFNEFLINQNTFSEARLKNEYPLEDSLGFLLSIDSLDSSRKTLIASLNNRETKLATDSLKKFDFWLQEFLRNEQLYGRYSLSPDRLNNLQSIVNLCQQNNIDLKVFLSPIHATQYETISVARLQSTFEQWKREVVKITPVWDFAYDNSITTEAIKDNMNHYIDSSHYSQNTGNLVLNRILNADVETIPQDFGVLITPDNIESHLLNSREKRKQWQNSHQEEVKLVEQINMRLQSK